MLAIENSDFCAFRYACRSNEAFHRIVVFSTTIRAGGYHRSRYTLYKCPVPDDREQTYRNTMFDDHFMNKTKMEQVFWIGFVCVLFARFPLSGTEKCQQHS